ncbi:hypothetical protein DF186_23415, partial [Enterococcus hirae]
ADHRHQPFAGQELHHPTEVVLNFVLDVVNGVFGGTNSLRMRAMSVYAALNVLDQLRENRIEDAVQRVSEQPGGRGLVRW